MSFQDRIFHLHSRGFVDMVGNVIKIGVLRLANAGDEILPLRDPRSSRTRVISRLFCLPELSQSSAHFLLWTQTVVESFTQLWILLICRISIRR